MTALTILQGASAWLALPIPSAGFAATDPQTIQLRSLLNEELYEVATWPDHNWVKLSKQTSFTTVAAPEQTGAIPTDFGRYIDESMWNRTTVRPVYNSLSAQQWQREKAGPTFTSVYLGARFRGNDLLLTPDPPAGQSVYYEYLSKWAVYASGDTTPTKEFFTADTDTCIFPDVLMERGVRWRFLRAKGLDYQQEYQSWIELLQRIVSRDGGMTRLNAANNYPVPRMAPFVPEVGFGP